MKQIKPMTASHPAFGEITVPTALKRTTGKTAKAMEIVDQDGVITKETLTFSNAYIVDEEKFVKLYIEGVKALTQLSQAGTKVFEVLYKQIQKHISEGQTHLSYNLAQKVADNVSRTVYHRGMKELQDKGFIVKSDLPGMYQINPKYLWNGDRIAFLHQIQRANATQPITIEGQVLKGNDQQTDIEDAIASNLQKETQNDKD